MASRSEDDRALAGTSKAGPKEKEEAASGRDERVPSAPLESASGRAFWASEMAAWARRNAVRRDEGAHCGIAIDGNAEARAEATADGDADADESRGDGGGRHVSVEPRGGG